MISAYLLEETGGARSTGYILKKERTDCTKNRKQRLQERVYPLIIFPAITELYWRLLWWLVLVKIGVYRRKVPPICPMDHHLGCLFQHCKQSTGAEIYFCIPANNMFQEEL
jgi:hypothetical protein